MATTPTKSPTRKVIAATGGGGVGQAFAQVFVYFLELALNHPMPDDIRLAFSIVITGLFSIAAGYLIPPAPDEVPREPGQP